MNTIAICDKIEKIATKIYSCELESSSSDSLFRSLIDVDCDGNSKSLLIVGSTHPYFGDGYCIAVLNPEKGLLQKITPGCAYNPYILKELVQGKCDLTLSLWINTNEGFNVSRSVNYKCRKPSARF